MPVAVVMPAVMVAAVVVPMVMTESGMGLGGYRRGQAQREERDHGEHRHSEATEMRGDRTEGGRVSMPLRQHAHGPVFGRPARWTEPMPEGSAICPADEERPLGSDWGVGSEQWAGDAPQPGLTPLAGKL
jgi:hypothetical protein